MSNSFCSVVDLSIKDKLLEVGVTNERGNETTPVSVVGGPGQLGESCKERDRGRAAA